VFRSLLGSELDQLSEALRRFSDAPTSAQGELTVTHHTGRMARFFIWILRLPKAGRGQTTTIQVSRTERTEYWRRRIGSSRFQTRHRALGPYLEERAGLFRFVHVVSVVDGGLHYRQERVYFLGLRLPHVFSPIIEAHADGDDRGWTLDLTVSCPRCGPICRYEGWITPA
jgi:hypothetical protein